MPYNMHARNCWLKRRYTNYLRALCHARELDRTNYDPMSRIMTYVCANCGGIHVGHDRSYRALLTDLAKVEAFLSNPDVQAKAKRIAITDAERRKAKIERELEHWKHYYLAEEESLPVSA